MKLLRIVFGAQLVVMGLAFALLTATLGNVYGGLLLVYFVPVGLVAMVYAAWQFMRHPARRGWALATAATPVICLATPFLIYRLNGGPVAPELLVGATMALVVAALATVLARAGRWRSASLFTGKGFNFAILLALGAGLALFWLPVVAVLAMHQSLSLPSDLAQRDMIIRVGVIYFMAVAAPSLCLAGFTLLYAPIGLVRDHGGRIVHLGQLLAALLMLASLTAGAFVGFLGMANPG